MSPSNAYHELCYYTLSHGGAEFIHQHVVDAHGAQDASPTDKPIRLVFSLIGLYLHVEQGFTGRDVQLAHMKLARENQDWPVITIPRSRGQITATTVLAASADRRDSMIHEWCRSVWEAYSAERETIQRILHRHRITDARSVQPTSRRKA